MKLVIAVIVALLLVIPCYASVTGQVYGNGQKAATLCASLEMYEAVDYNGFIDLNRDGSWFTKNRLFEGKGNLRFAQEYRASSSGYRSLATGPQLNVHDFAGSWQVTAYVLDTAHQKIISTCQFHNLGGRFWTWGWADVPVGTDNKPKLKEAKGTVRVGYKETTHTDIFLEYRFNCKSHDNGIYAGINIH